MKVHSPVQMTIPRGGVCFAESMHGKGFRMAEREDPFHKVIYVLEGIIEYLQPGKKNQPVAKGGILIIPAGVRHRIRDERPATLLVLGIDREFLEGQADLGELWRVLSRLPGLALGTAERRRVESIWRRALIESGRGRAGTGCILRALAMEAVVTLARAETTVAAPGGARERVEAVAREVEDSFSEPWTLDAAASRAGLSRRRFSTLHRELFGESFLERLTALRVAHAARLLQRGEATVLGAMFASGFNDLSHFYRVFRARYGKPPGTWASSRPGVPGSPAPRRKAGSAVG